MKHDQARLCVLPPLSGSCPAGLTSTTATNQYTNTYNRLNQYTNINASWDAGASSSSSTLLYDQNGNLARYSAIGTGGGASGAFYNEYSYDDSDRLSSAVRKDPTTGAYQSKSEFVYDGLSRLRTTREYSWTAGAWVLVPGSEKRRVYDGMDVIQERDSTNAVTTTYTRDGNIGGILSKRTGGNDYFFHYDGSGNVVGLSDSTQASVAEYSYDAWGNTITATGVQASNNLYRFSTKELHSATGFYNYGYRFYSAGLGRFINRDPLREGGGVNLYAAFANSPTNFGDAYGLYILAEPSTWFDGNGYQGSGLIIDNEATHACGQGSLDHFHKSP